MTQASPIDPLVEAIAQRTAALVLERLSGAAPAGPRPYLTIRELCDELHASQPTVRRMMKAGRIPFVMLGDSPRFDLAEVRAALAKWRTEQSGAPIRCTR